MLFLPVLLFLWGVSLLRCTEIIKARGRLRRFDTTDTTKLNNINEALNACRSGYSDLVTIYDEDENKKTVENISFSKTAWIGAVSCKWSNGDPVTFVNFSVRFSATNYCGAINTDRSWEFSDCNSTKRYFICSNQDHEKQSQNYSLILENRSWFEAQLYCREKHTDLVTIRDETENEQVKEKLKGDNSFWIGLRYDNNSLDWLDGGHSNYKPNFMFGSHGCFTYLSRNGPWQRTNDGQYFALCYKSFIHVSEDKMSWEKALDYCERNDSQLLSIHSEKEQDQTELELKRRKISGPVWVGLRQSRVFGFWIWTSGIQVGNWTNWKGGNQPKYSHHCGAMEEENGEYKWCDKDCRSEFIAVCVKK